ncbi:MAG: CoA transferase [Actinomycetota bacterium]
MTTADRSKSDENRAESTTSASVTADLLTLADLPAEAVDRVRFTGPDIVLPSSFPVTTAARSVIAATSVAVAEVAARCAGRTGPGGQIMVDSIEACAAVQSERHLRLDRPVELWDELAGHYRSRDGHIQFHTNFPHHRKALLEATGCPADADREQVAAEVATVDRSVMEERVSAAGGIAAALRTPAEWDAHPHRAHVAGRPPLRIDRQDRTAGNASPVPLGAAPIERPLAGIRVLDCTRVIAGPVCTRTLAAYGADVLRIGAPDVPVVDSILPDTTLGKRFADADITTNVGRDTLRRLAADADVMVVGYRPGALDGRGLGPDELFEANPNLVLATLSAFGADGPWGGKRGFDSITQTATGIVAAEMRAYGTDTPRPLPCQLLDHATGFLLALGVLRALSTRNNEGGGWLVEASLLTTRNWLESLGTADPDAGRQLSEEDVAPFLESRPSPFGPITHVRHPGWIDGIPARWDVGPSKPGQHEPSWQPRYGAEPTH